MKNAWLLVLSFVSVMIVFHVCYGLQTIVPTNISWLMTILHDWGTHYLGWDFFRHEPWHFPIGHVSNYLYPLGTNVGFTDSAPLLAILFKIFSPILPEDFQYFGMWLFVCHLLAAYYTILLFRLFRVRPVYTLLAVIFIASNPVLVYRGLHPALCGHWLLIASLYVYFLNPHHIKPNRILIYQFILLMIATLINPYLGLMVFGFAFITPLKLCFFDKVISKKKFVIYLAGTLIALLLSWYVVGLIQPGKKEDLAVESGFGLYGLNLNSLYNPSGFSSFLPQLKQVSWHQYEGFMYLGMGIFLLIFVLLLYGLYGIITKRAGRKNDQQKFRINNTAVIPLLLLVIAFTMFSITHTITLNDKVLLKIPIPEWLNKIGEIFRASSRFFWLSYYLIIIFSLIAIAKSKLSHLFKLSILLLALGIQLYDIKALLGHRNLTYGSYTPPIDKNWSTLIKHFDQIVFDPPFQAHQLTPWDYQYFCFLASRERKPINIGYAARLDNNAMKLYVDSLHRNLSKGKLSAHALYITTAPHLNNFSFLLQTGISQLNMLNGYYYLFENGKNQNLVGFTNELNKTHRAQLDSAISVFGKKLTFNPVAKMETGQNKSILYNIENFTKEDTHLSLSGWAIIDTTQNNKGDSVSIFLHSKDGSYISSTHIADRPDITANFKKGDLNDAGFNAIIFMDKVEQGRYLLGISIKNKEGKSVYQLSDRTIKHGIPDFAVMERISNQLPAGDIQWGLDQFTNDNGIITISGWAAFRNQGADKSEVILLFKKGEEIYRCTPEYFQRPDVTAHFNNKYKLDNSGFNVKVSKSSLPKGKYQLGILISDNSRNKKGVVYTDREIIVP